MARKGPRGSKAKRRAELRDELQEEYRERVEGIVDAPEEVRAEAVDAFDAMLVLVSLEKRYEGDDVNMVFTQRMKDSVMVAIDCAYACGLRDGQARP